MALILTDDYLGYKEPKSPYTFFLILIFNELFKFKTSEEWQHRKTGRSTLEWKDIDLLFTQSSRSLCFLYGVATTFRTKI